MKKPHKKASPKALGEAVRPGAEAPLETTAKSVGHSGGRAARFRHQRHAAALMAGQHRVGLCRWSVVSRAAGVDVVTSAYKDGVARAHYEGLQTCGSVWACPCCSARISEVRREEMGQLLSWARGRGYHVRMVTLTCRHGRHDDLSDLLLRLKGRTKNDEKGIKGYLGAKQRLSTDRRWRDHVQPHVVGSVTATEVTGGGRHGWHPHMHMILILDQDIDLTPMRDAWHGSLRAVGLDGTGQGWDVRDADHMGEYLAKWGAAEEIALSGKKRGRRGGGRTPAQLLAASSDEGDDHAGMLWAEYAVTFHGRRQLVWTRGLKKAVGIKDRKDKDIARDERQEEQTETGRAHLTHETWQRVAARGADYRADLLDRAEEAGAEVAVVEAEAGLIGGDVIDEEPRQASMPRPLIQTDGLAARAMAGIMSDASRACARREPTLWQAQRARSHRQGVSPSGDGVAGSGAQPRPSRSVGIAPQDEIG